MKNPLKNRLRKLNSNEDHWDVLVTTAGLFIGGTLTEFKVEDWDSLMKINARAVLSYQD